MQFEKRREVTVIPVYDATWLVDVVLLIAGVVVLVILNRVLR